MALVAVAALVNQAVLATLVPVSLVVVEVPVSPVALVAVAALVNQAVLATLVPVSPVAVEVPASPVALVTRVALEQAHRRITKFMARLLVGKSKVALSSSSTLTSSLRMMVVQILHSVLPSGPNSLMPKINTTSMASMRTRNNSLI